MMLKQLDILIGFVTVMAVVSMLITIVTQLVSSFLNLRGNSLRDALEAVFKTVAPTMPQPDAKALAEAMLKHPLVSDSIMGGGRQALASAIRPEEILPILHDLAAANSTASAAVRASANTLLNTLNTGATVVAVANTAATAAAATAQAIAGHFAALDPASATFANDVQRAQVAVANQMATLTNNATAGIANAQQQITKYFGMVEDRSREWFATHTQITTYVLAGIFAFGLQLDTIDLFKRLSTDDQLRAQLVAQAAVVQKQAEGFVDKSDKARAALHATALKATKAALGTPDTIGTALDTLPPDLNNDTAITDWVVKKLPGNAKAGDIAKTYLQQFGEAQNPYLHQLVTDLKSTKTSLAKAGFNLVPDPYPGFCEFFVDSFHHFFGLVMTGLLLSLGAPYWFNLLKTLTNLRPKLSTAVDDDEQAKKGGKKTGS